MRLIDADELKFEIASLVVGGERRIYEVMPRSGNDWVDGIASAYREIDNAPTIHKARWIADDEFGNCHCSNCRYEHSYQPDYCEQCGAYMLGDESDE